MKRRAIFLSVRNSEYPRIFQVTGANQNARKLLSTDFILYIIQLSPEGEVNSGGYIGESLFTLFASLTYAYHYLMTLIK